MKKIFIITGEYSGNIHAAKVVELLKQSNQELEIEGIGSEDMANAGVKLFCDHSKMSGFGFSFKMAIEHLQLEDKVVNYLVNDYKPDFVLLIDYGTFNLRVAKRIRKHGIKVFHYIPPQVWASRKWRINGIKKNVDKVLCIFPFEEDMYKSEGIDVHYCGHPLVKQLPMPANKDEFFAKHSLDTNRPLVSIFPGSRPLELCFFAKTFIESAKKLQKLHPELQFCISHAPNLSDNVFDKYIKDTDFKIIKGENQALLSVSDSLILASGTVALEAALYERPMLIGYRGPWVLYLIYLLVRCIDMVSLPNIILNKVVVPELVQHKFTVDNICYETEKFLYNKEYRENFVKEISRVKEKLSDKYSAKEVADEILKVL